MREMRNNNEQNDAEKESLLGGDDDDVTYESYSGSFYDLGDDDLTDDEDSDKSQESLTGKAEDAWDKTKRSVSRTWEDVKQKGRTLEEEMRDDL